MANAMDRRAVFEQALEDGGVRGELRLQCCECFAKSDWNTLEQLLAQHRKTLLEEIHCGQDRLDCIDYLTHRFQNGM